MAAGDKALANLQLLLGITALSITLIIVFRLFTQISFDQQASSNYGYYFVTFTLTLIGLVFSVTYVGSGVTAVVFSKLPASGERYAAGLIKMLIFNAFAIPCLFVQVVLSLIALFYFASGSLLQPKLQQRQQQQQQKVSGSSSSISSRQRLYYSMLAFSANLLFCATIGCLAVRLMRRVFRLWLRAFDSLGFSCQELHTPLHTPLHNIQSHDADACQLSLLQQQQQQQQQQGQQQQEQEELELQLMQSTQGCNGFVS